MMMNDVEDLSVRGRARWDHRLVLQHAIAFAEVGMADFLVFEIGMQLRK